MKKIISVILLVITIFSIMPTALAGPQDTDTTIEEFELWSMSPCISGGMSRYDLVFQKALYNNYLTLYPLPKLGERYTLAATWAPMYNTGVKGNTTLYEITYFLLYLTDDSYEILDRAWLWSDHYDGTTYLADIADYINDNQPGDKPLYITAAGGVYSSSSWDWYIEYVVVTDKQKLVIKREEKQERSMSVYDGCLWWAYKPTSNGVTLIKQKFEGSGCTNDGYIGLETAQMTEENGYINFTKPFSNVTVPTYYNLMPSEDLYFTYRYYDNYNAEFNIYKQNGYNVEHVTTSTITGSPYTINSYYFMTVNNLDKDYYRNRDNPVPCLILQNNNSHYIVTDTGVIGKLTLDTATYYSTSYYMFATYNRKLVLLRCMNGRSYIYKNDDQGQNIQWEVFNYVNVKPNGEVELSEDVYLPMPYNQTPNEGQNGYYYSGTRYVQSTDIGYNSVVRTDQYFKRKKTNVFSDGKTAGGSWVSNGSNYEYWYRIYLPDGRLCATGPTGFYADSDAYNYDPFVIVENDTKFVVGNTKPIDDHIREFYKVATVRNTDTGEAKLVGASIGRKNITSNVETDTEPVQSVIDFAEDNLPIGFNIKSNVIDADNFTVDTREQFNRIKLNDIVILKNGKKQSGTQNTGVTLDSFSNISDEFGDIKIRFYTNGQNFCWTTATDTTMLNTGTYNKYFVVGDKTIYVTIKIVDIPTSDGVTTVVF